MPDLDRPRVWRLVGRNRNNQERTIHRVAPSMSAARAAGFLILSKIDAIYEEPPGEAIKILGLSSNEQRVSHA